MIKTFVLFLRKTSLYRWNNFSQSVGAMLVTSLCHRLKRVLSDHISEIQSVFVFKRKINDNYDCSRDAPCVLMNGHYRGNIVPERGLNVKETILSSSIFILCMEVLASLLNQTKNQGKITGMCVSSLTC